MFYVNDKLPQYKVLLKNYFELLKTRIIRCEYLKYFEEIQTKKFLHSYCTKA